MTAKQERQLHQNPLTGAFIPPPSNQDQSEARVGVNGARASWEIPSAKQHDGSFIKPKCAVYFDTLMKANWESFGIDESMSGTPNVLAWAFMELYTHEAKALHYELSVRLTTVEIGRKYANFFQKAILDGMDEASSREFAARKLILETGEARGPGNQHPDSNDDDWIRNIDKVFCVALRWKHLVDTIGVPEIALIGYERGNEFEWDDIPIPNIELVSNEEYDSLRIKLLDPALRLKETCLKLSGVVGMIQRLKDLKDPNIRAFLAQEIKRRVKDVLGSPERLDMSEEEEEDDDESMADAEISQDVDVAGLDGLKGIDFSRI
ncbi:hypothetical protein N7491_010353 [Penicillium cf. griseofulvum]|uniref:Uncharacterized protein n=1 Tax=Penicillium cf. griseofulvum TaxID=2972120 RepID=A0A9W9T5Z7_9EURO|nr:hypothetical protein N7472_000685 [Penicillium cf. griseofulvum]KAJ5421908.1 hypothetical protein N7491_010353 [Penicillium cf. griseofulvum]KAJ5428099.1 hypothetical protein N7445_009553 [Penicillium cf. griseofulvum]